MKRALSMTAIVTLAGVVAVQAFAGRSDSGLRVRSVEITPRFRLADGLKREVPNPGPAIVHDFPMDAYTAPWSAFAPPSLFSVEQYSFGGGSAGIIDHRVVYNKNTILGGG